MPRRPPGPSMSAIHTSPAKSIGLVPSLSTTTTMTTVSSSSPPGLGMSPSPPTIGGQDRHANENSPRVPPVKKDRRVRAGLSAKPVAVSTTASSNPSATSFDVRSILPDTRPRKSLSKLLEASSSVNKFLSSASTAQLEQMPQISATPILTTRFPLKMS
ncbi:hypothetical protein BDZ97DRAFT_692710 [Flammula alnicola]|nr:hypothetical protein BDZ97DRAFT_692710 [Flammula alnicola]